MAGRRTLWISDQRQLNLRCVGHIGGKRIIPFADFEGRVIGDGCAAADNIRSSEYRVERPWR